MLASGFNVLRNFLSSEPVPNTKVLQVKLDTYASRDIHCRDESSQLVLYLPAKSPGSAKTESQFHEIVFHRPYNETLNHMYSLYRTSNFDDAEIRFISMQDKLSVFMEIAKEMYNLQGLQKLCDILAEHPTWNIAHLAAHFNRYDAFRHDKVCGLLNSSSVENGLSPLQVAILTKHVKTVQVMVQAGACLEHLDHHADGAFHFAATTTKEIIQVLTQGSQQPPKCLNSRNHNGYTPLHIACQADKPDCVKALLLAGADVNKSSAGEGIGGTASMSALSSTSSSNVASTSGVTGGAPNNSITSPTGAQSTAMAEMKPGYVGDFLQLHPRSLFNEDMKMGGTPLHWACSRPVIEALLDMDCHIDAPNFSQQTALHVMVMRNRLECVVALLSHHADINLGDADGNRPLHLAVKAGHLAIIQCLLVFDADLDCLNNAGQSARHLLTEEQLPTLLYYLHAVGASRCPSDIASTCTRGCRFDGTYNGEPPPPVLGPTKREALDHLLDVSAAEIAVKRAKENASERGDPGATATRWKRSAASTNTGRVLCLDGGGIRGLVLVVMLMEIERVLQKPIRNCFEWIAGTSTGGILALGLAVGKTLRECLCLYFRIKSHTFVGMRPYPSEPLENVLKETYGAETVMTDIVKPKVMVTGVLADRKPVELHLFRNYESPSDILQVKQLDSPYEVPPLPGQQYIWQVGRATGAAPTYFRAFGRFLDGGLVANNPTLDALSEIHEYNLALSAVGREAERVPVTMVLSLGTGLIPVTPVKDIDIFLPGNILDSFKLYTGISTLGALLVDQATAADGRVVDRARAWCSSIGVPYFRLSPQMSEDIAMNESADEKLCKMLWETKAYMHENSRMVRSIVDVLTKEDGGESIY